MTTKPELYHGNGFIAEIIRSNRRRTATIKVEADRVAVLIPKNLSATSITELLNKKTRWIREKIRLQQQSPPFKPKQYVAGEEFGYLGSNYRLQLVTGKTPSVELKNGRLLVTAPNLTAARIQQTLTQWYSEQARQKLCEKTAHYARILGVQPQSIRIKAFKSRWGSCHSNGAIQYNWQIIIAPNRIVDYIVVHELCHLIHHNHSAAFWECVGQIMPDYPECKAWLKLNGKSLVI